MCGVNAGTLFLPNSINSLHLQRLGGDEPEEYGELISQHRGGKTSYYHYDALGSTRQLTDETETVTDSYTYNAWGEIIEQTGTTTNPFRWIGNVGYYWDEETQDYYVRARYYQPQSGRWMTQDPLMFADGVNLYLAYFVPNGIDPNGMAGTGVNDCFKSLGNCVQNRCSAYLGETNPDTTGYYEKCKRGCEDSFLDCLDSFVYFPIQSLPASSPECNKYCPDDKYSNASARCFCKCAGDSQWSQYVRGCLRQLYSKGVSPDAAHNACYLLASEAGFKMPGSTLAYCYLKCFDYIPFV